MGFIKMSSDWLEIRKSIIETLCSVGGYVDEEIIENAELDLEISQFITESLIFVSFIIELEERFGIEFPDDLLSIDTLSSLNGFVSLVEELLNTP